MSAHIPNAIPATVVAGDTVTWRITAPLFPAGIGWQLQTTLINATGKIAVTSAADGDAHLVNVAASVTTDWAPGRYTWATRAVREMESYTVAVGEIEIKPDLAVAEYEIAGRRMKYTPIAELIKLRDQYRREVRQQSSKSGRILLRF